MEEILEDESREQYRVTAGELRQFVERYERLEAERKDLADLVLRLLHVVSGIAWIGASFYFIRLDLGLRAPEDAADAERGVAGEDWGVHGGGFYHSQKYTVAP